MSIRSCEESRIDKNKCSKCGMELTKQNWRGYDKKHYAYICSSCRREIDRKRYLVNRKRILRLNRIWRSKNKERIKYTNKIWSRKNQHRRNILMKERFYKLKVEVFRHYSPKLICQKCGFLDTRALSIDHIKGGGNKKRKRLGLKSGRDFYIWLKKKGFPSGFQVLCMNCQWIKRWENNEV